MSAVRDVAAVVSMPIPGQRRAPDRHTEPRRLRLVGAPDRILVDAGVDQGTISTSCPGEVADGLARLHRQTHLEQSVVRLTPRGRLAAIAVTLAAAAALVVSAYLCAPRAPTSAVTVTVRPGDTLWGLAARVAPRRDPRVVIAELQHVNGLQGTVLIPGEQLHVG